MYQRLTMMYQISYNLIDFNAERYLIPHTESRTRGSYPLKYQIPKAKNDVFKYSYIPRTIKDWNNLSHDIVLTDSLNKFKVKLDSYFQVLLLLLLYYYYNLHLIISCTLEF